MRPYLLSTPWLGVLVVALCCSTESALGQITGIVNSNVEGYFGTNSDAFQLAEGPTIPPWPASGPGFYPVSGLPGVPQLYPGFPNPVFPLTTNISYSAPITHAPATPFTDGQTTANYTITGGYNAPGTATGDAYVQIGVPGAVPLTINQPSTASGYAYEQVNFAMLYSVGPGGLAAGSPGPRPLSVTGSLATGGWAQFGAEVNYWFLTNIPGTTTITSTTFLGSLQYDLQLTSTGPFSQWVNYNGAGSLLGAAGSGYLMITGDAFVAGDPFTLSVQSVPEPSTLALAGCGAIALVALARRRRRD